MYSSHNKNTLSVCSGLHTDKGHKLVILSGPFIFPPPWSVFQKLRNKGLSHTDEGDGLLVEHSAGQQVEVILHRVHHHRVTCVVAPLQTHKTNMDTSWWVVLMRDNTEGGEVNKRISHNWGQLCTTHLFWLKDNPTAIFVFLPYMLLTWLERRGKEGEEQLGNHRRPAALHNRIRSTGYVLWVYGGQELNSVTFLIRHEQIKQE